MSRDASIANHSEGIANYKCLRFCDDLPARAPKGNEPAELRVTESIKMILSFFDAFEETRRL